MEIKKFRIILVGVIIFVVIVSIAAVFYTISAKKNTSRSSQSESNAMYVLKDFEGRVAVFKANEGTPYKILDVYTSTLPNTDQITLSNDGGIPIEDEEGLAAIIEDFES